jgi:acyl dehydratase
VSRATTTRPGTDPRIGHRAEPWSYEIGAEKVREYAAAVGETSPIYFDRAAARAAGFADIPAPPMFAVVYCRWMAPLIHDEALGVDYDRMLHGAQEFTWSRVACVGDVITTTAEVVDVYAKGALTFFEFESVSTDARGGEVVRGIWTMIVRGA